MPFRESNSERVLVLAERRRNSEVACRLLADAGFAALVCSDTEILTRELRKGAGCLLITEETIDGSAAQTLHDWVQVQPPWSELPIIVVTIKADATMRIRSSSQWQDTLGNVSFVERPFHAHTLTSLVGAALRSRRRQYKSRELLERYELLARELQHRTKNLLAVILSIAGASLRDGGDGRDVFVSRLHALAAAQDLLMEGDGRGTFLVDIVRAVTSSFGDRIGMGGPQVHLTPTLAQGFALIVHELATNAVKHGALVGKKVASRLAGRLPSERTKRPSTSNGRSAVVPSFRRRHARVLVPLCWNEPSPRPAIRPGFIMGRRASLMNTQ